MRALRVAPSAGPSDGLSFEDLYERHADQVYAWAMRYARGQSAWAEDLVHDVFVKSLQHLPELRADEVQGWLFRTTQNLAFSRLKREGWLLGRLGWIRAPSLQGEAPPTPEELLERQHAAKSATAALQRLPGKEQVVVAMKVLDGMSQREIAQMLELSEGYVSKLLARAWERLSAWGWEVDDERP